MSPIPDGETEAQGKQRDLPKATQPTRDYPLAFSRVVDWLRRAARKAPGKGQGREGGLLRAPEGAETALTAAA